MVSATVLINLLLASFALAAPSLDPSFTRRATVHQLNTTQYLEAPVRDIKFSERTGDMAGAILSGPAGFIESVSGVFIIPTISPPSGSPRISNSSAGAWVGIDGDTCTSGSLAAGVDIHITNGIATYIAWCKWSNQVHQLFGLDLKPGNTVSLTVIATSPTSGHVYASNLSKGVSGTADLSSANPLCGQDALWVVRPFSPDGGYVQLADFSTIVIFHAITGTKDGRRLYANQASIMNFQQQTGPQRDVLTTTILDSTTVAVNYIGP